MGRRTSKGKPSEKSIPVKISPVASETTPFYYCNFVSVAHTQYDFLLSFLRIPVFTSLSEAQKDAVKKGNPLPVEPSFQVAIAPKLIDELITALTEQKRKYEARFGPVETRRKNTK